MYHESRLKHLADKYDNIFVYLNDSEQMPTKNLIDTWLSEKKSIMIPKVNENKNSIKCHIIKSKSDLSKDYLENIEISENTKTCSKSNADVFIIPGVKFENKECIIGKGEGIFREFLKDIKDKPVIALAHDKDISNELDIIKCNYPVDLILTETREIVCNDKFSF